MAKKASRKKAARAKVPSGMTTLIVGEEGGHPTTLALGEEIHPTTLAFGEEIHPTTLIYGEEHPTLYFGEHGPSNPLVENPSNLIAEQFPNIGDPGGPVERQAAVAVKSAPKRRKKRL
jgi:hypothetical protein